MRKISIIMFAILVISWIPGEVLSQDIFGRTYADDQNESRLLLSPTARPIRSGQGYISDYDVFFPLAALGIMDVISLAGGMTIFPTTIGQVIYLAPKVTPIRWRDLDLAAGFLAFSPFGESDFKSGIAYGMLTAGKSSAGVTVGVGYGYAEDEFKDEMILLIGGELQVAEHTKFITENWLVPGSSPNLLFFGFRFMNKNVAADAALLYPSGTDAGLRNLIPWMGFAVNFNLWN
jgi:hypothetical protein